MRFSMIPGAGSCDMQVPILSSVGKGPKGDKGDTGGIEYPKVASPIQWDPSVVYEPFTLVLDDSGNSYMSLSYVPIGTQLSDSDYWVRTGVFNAQVAQCYEQIEQCANDITAFVGRFRIGETVELSIPSGGMAARWIDLDVPFGDNDRYFVIAQPLVPNEDLSFETPKYEPDRFSLRVHNGGESDISVTFGYMVVATHVE